MVCIFPTESPVASPLKVYAKLGGCFVESFCDDRAKIVSDFASLERHDVESFSEAAFVHRRDVTTAQCARCAAADVFALLRERPLSFR